MMSRGENRIKFPNPDIAMAVAADWEYFHDKIDPKRMPLVCKLNNYSHHILITKISIL